MLVGFVWLEFQVAGIYTEADEVFVGELDVIGVLWLRLIRCRAAWNSAHPIIGEL